MNTSDLLTTLTYNVVTHNDVAARWVVGSVGWLVGRYTYSLSFSAHYLPLKYDTY